MLFLNYPNYVMYVKEQFTQNKNLAICSPPMLIESLVKLHCKTAFLHGFSAFCSLRVVIVKCFIVNEF